MTMLEKKIDALLRAVCAEDEESRKEAIKEARAMRKIERTEDVKDMDVKIRDCAECIIFELGVQANLKGYDYLVESISLCAKDKEYIEMITKKLYPEVAKRHNTTPSRVERAMRHAIEVTFDRCDLDYLHALFGNSVAYNKDKPTNSEFIARMAKEVIKRTR